MRFRYTALDSAGFPQKGELEAIDEQSALTQLYGRAYTPIELHTLTETSNPNRIKNTKIKHAETIALIRELATLLNSGVGISEAIITLREATGHSSLVQILDSLATSIHSGSTVATAFLESQLNLPEYVHALIKAGEATGDLAGALGRCAEQLDFDEKMRQETKEALTYPVILILTGIASVVFIFSFVVPRFASILKGRDVDLPLLSEWVLVTGVFFNENWMATVIVCAMSIVLSGTILRKRAARITMTRFFSRLPLLSNWIEGSETARWTSILAILVQSKVPILMALELASTAVRLPNNASRLRSVADEVRLGKKLSSVMEERHLLKGSALTMLKVGEKSGQLGSMMEYIAKHASERHQALQRRVVSLIEPISILTIGSTLGVIMVGVVLAMTSLTDVKL
jgi:general secretion pathway protein F